jgi:hypothetical protein
MTAAYLPGTLLVSWFWLPIVVSYSHVQNIGHQMFVDNHFSWYK